MYDGGGIEPDIPMKPERLSKLTQTLILKHLVFDFATKFSREHDSIAPPDQFTISDDIYNEFTGFLKNKNYSYKTGCEEALVKLKASAEKEDYFNAIKSDYNDMEAKITHDKEGDLTTYRNEISEILKSEIVSRYYFQKGRVIASLKTDPEIAKAIEVLEGKSTYVAILDGSLKMPKENEDTEGNATEKE